MDPIKKSGVHLHKRENIHCHFRYVLKKSMNIICNKKYRLFQVTEPSGETADISHFNTYISTGTIIQYSYKPSVIFVNEI